MPTPGVYKQSPHGYKTFFPDALPPRLTLSTGVARQVEEATHLLGRVEMCRALLPNADLLIYSSLQREALASSTIEGTIASPDELVRYQVSEQAEHGAVREVANYSAALEWGAAQITALPLASRLILGLHERLLADVRGASGAGRFKDQQNYIGSHPQASIGEAIFVPASPDDTPDLIAALERYINLENQEPRVVQCALTHYQFETIHPFNDGNGRVGRLLIVLQLMQLGLLSAPLIYPSVYFERTRDAYYQHLQSVRQEGKWNDWVEYFARGICIQCRETIDFTQMILRLRKRMHDEIGHVQRRASLSAVLDAFFQDPVLSLRQIVQKANIAPNTAQAAVMDLQERKIVYEITQKQKGRVYACRQVLDAVFGRPTE